jgi:hypothetical protein
MEYVKNLIYNDVRYFSSDKIVKIKEEKNT